MKRKTPTETAAKGPGGDKRRRPRNLVNAIRESRSAVPESWWPDDLPEYVFLGRAIGAWGRARYKEEWTGGERGVDYGDAWRRTHFAEDSRQAEAWAILETYEPEQARAKEAERWQPAKIDEEDWPLVVGHQNALVRSSKRWTDAVSAMVEKFRSGAIRSFVRPISGGALEEFPPNRWNYEGYVERFESLSVDPEAPFGDDSDPWPSGPTHYLYVSRTDLERVTGAISQFPFTPGLYERLSPYLKLMLHVASKLDAGAIQRDPAKADVESAIEASWGNFVDISHLGQSKRRWMATFVRHPDSGSTGKG